jgi:hypothetical protein
MTVVDYIQDDRNYYRPEYKTGSELKDYVAKALWYFSLTGEITDVTFDFLTNLNMVRNKMTDLAYNDMREGYADRSIYDECRDIPLAELKHLIKRRLNGDD